jgi:hypothetical protein
MKASNIESVNNPMYEWYQPNMTRKECTQYLLAQGEGSFIIRDSTATPGWHMLGVKMNNEVIHEKIRFTEEGMYEIITNKTDKKQPRFNSLAHLVEFYLHPQEDSPYCLAISNPIYDNHHLTQNNISYELATDFDAPSLPLKDNQVENIKNIAQNGVVINKNYNGDNDNNDEIEIYTNTKQAKEALSERANYVKSIDSDYLITGNDCDEK